MPYQDTVFCLPFYLALRLNMPNLKLSLLLLLSFCLSASAKTIVYDDVTKLQGVESDITKHVKNNAGNILVVFDIDDTLLEANSFVGGDTWYNWQRGRSIEGTNGETIEIHDQDKMSCLFSKLGVLYELGAYHATEPEATSIVAALQNKIDLMALTSRSPGYRAATERELKKAGFDFARAHLLAKTHALAYKLNDGKSSRDVSYQNGIVMSTGLNKGVVLDDLLMRLNRRYTAIFFIDDSRKNINNMDVFWQDKQTLVKIYHYTGVDKTLSREEIIQAKSAKQTFDAFISAAFPGRADQFAQGECN